MQEMQSFITCDRLSEKVQIASCCIDEPTCDPHVITTLFLHQHSWYSVLAGMLHMWQLSTKIMTSSAVICTIWQWQEHTISCTSSHTAGCAGHLL